jgi:exopolysaccharide biosynthesis protein
MRVATLTSTSPLRGCLYGPAYTRKNAQVVTSLQTSCHKSVHKLSTSCVRIACSQIVVTSLKQAVNNL